MIQLLSNFPLQVITLDDCYRTEMFQKKLNSLVIHPKIPPFWQNKSLRYNQNLKKSAKTTILCTFFSPIYAAIAFTDMQLVLNPTPDTIQFPGNQAYMQPKLQQQPYHFFARKYLSDCCEHRKSQRIILVSASECEESDIFIFVDIPFKFRFFCFFLQPWFSLSNMPFLIFYTASRDEAHVCFHSFLETFMRSQGGNLVSLPKFNSTPIPLSIWIDSIRFKPSG